MNAIGPREQAKEIAYQVRDRLSFMRFPGLGLGDRVPDAKTVWLYRDALVQAGKVEALFGLFDGHLARQGYSRGVGRSLTRPSCRCVAPTTRARKMQRQRLGRPPKVGQISPPSDARRTWTRAGRRSTESRITATRTT